MSLDLIRPGWLGAPPNVTALSTTRGGGVSVEPYGGGSQGGGLNLGTHVGDSEHAVAENRTRLRQFLPADPVWLNQVHGTRVIDAARAIGSPEADASFTSQSGVVCVIQTADCLPVLFCDVEGRAVGAAHAGWRGLAGGVLENTLAAMRAAGAGEILAWLGPAIGPQRFEVGAEVRQAFLERDERAASHFQALPDDPEKSLADIYGLARLFLQRANIKGIYGGGYCTVSEKQRFYSFRRDKITGRMASCIWLLQG